MLAKLNRISQDKDFKKLKQKGRSLSSPHLRFKYLANNLSSNRFAVVVSLKVSKKATERNRIRRQLLEIIRLNLSKIKASFDFLIFVNNKALGLDYSQLETSLLATLEKGHLLKNGELRWTIPFFQFGY